MKKTKLFLCASLLILLLASSCAGTGSQTRSATAQPDRSSTDEWRSVYPAGMKYYCGAKQSTKSTSNTYSSAPIFPPQSNLGEIDLKGINIDECPDVETSLQALNRGLLRLAAVRLVEHVIVANEGSNIFLRPVRA